MAATHPLGGPPSAHWYTPSDTCNRANLLALLRTGAIAVVLLVILALIILS